VRSVTDERVLADLATSDPSEEVRRAAIAAVIDEGTLERIALRDDPLAIVAAPRVNQPAALIRLAKSAPRPEVRQNAVVRVKDSNTLQRIAALDLDATVRALARTRAGGPDPATNYLRGMISKLPVSERKGEPAEISGTLDDLCRALTQDPRFFINGEVVEDEANGAASVANPTQAPWTIPAFPIGRGNIRFLAQSRTPWHTTTTGPAEDTFYHIKVWRVGEDRYDAIAAKKQISPTSDPITWSQASGGSPQV
jgi:hypothetical protein